MSTRSTILVVSMFLLGMTTASALALAPCDEVVVDSAELLTPREEATIAEAAQTLELLGTTVYVRTSTGSEVSPYSSLHDAADAVCNWETNRIVYWVTVDENNVGMFPGPIWKAEVTDQEVEQVIDTAMIPALEAGSVASAFLRAIEATPQFMKVTPAAESVPSTVGTPEKEPVVPVVITQAPEANKWSFATVVAVLLGLMVVIIGGFAYRYFLVITRIRQAAVLLGNQCKEKLLGFNTVTDRLKEQLKTAVDHLSVADVAAFEARLQVVSAEADVANQMFNGNLDPSTLWKSLGWYQELHESLVESTKILDHVAGKFQTLEADMAAAMVVAASTEEEITRFTSELGTYTSRLAAVEKAGFDVQVFNTSLATLASAIPEVEALAAQRRFAEATKRMAAVRSEGLEVVKAAEALPKLQQRLITKHAELTKVFVELPKDLANAAKAFSDLEASCAEACYESIKGNGTEAEVALDTVDDVLAAAQTHIVTRAFTDAETKLKIAGELLEQAEALIDAIFAKQEQIDRAREVSKSELTEARRSIEVAAEYLKQHVADTRHDHYRVLSEARTLCAEVAAELKKKRPHFIEALKRAVTADDLADQVLKLAQTEQERVERERRRANMLVETARQELTDLRQYMRVHHDDMSPDTLRAMQQFDVLHREVGEVDGVARRIAYARTVSEHVVAVFALARRDFAAAEAERERTRELVRQAAADEDAREAADRRRREASSRPVTMPIPAPAPRVGTQEPIVREAVRPDRQWGARPASRESSGVEKPWRSVTVQAPSGGTTKPFSFTSTPNRGGKSGGLTKKW